MGNLIEGLMKEIERCEELKKMYDELPNGIGNFGSMSINFALSKAREAIKEGDVVKELYAYEELKTIEG